MALLPFENLMQVFEGSIISQAEKELEEGWTLSPYTAFKLTYPINWGLDNSSLRAFNYYIHCWEMLNLILLAYSTTKEIRFLTPAIDIALDWISHHSGTNKKPNLSPFAWYDMAVGFRTHRLAYIIDAAIDADIISYNIQKILWQALDEHRLYLADENNIVFRNNHGFFQIAGQLSMGKRFKDKSPLMDQAYKQAIQRLRTILATQFTKEGVHCEHSPGYHLMVYKTLKALIDFSLIEDSKIIEQALHIERSLSWFVLPDRHIANFGDTDYQSLAQDGVEALKNWSTVEMQYAVSNGTVGKLPSCDHIIFSEGGYVVVRKPSLKYPDKFRYSSYLAQIAAFHSRVHKQADDLSFIWSDRGSNILVDSGRYGYIGRTEIGSDLFNQGFWYSDPKRIYVESTRAHNTLEFNGNSYQRKKRKPYGSAIRRWMCNENGIMTIESEVKHFRTIHHVRVLIFMPAQWLIVFDWFNDAIKNTHTARQWFHLAPELYMVQEEQGFSVSVPSSKEPLRIVHLLDGITSSCVYLANDKDILQGWYSPKEKVLIPNYAFCYETQQTSNGCIASLFNFSSSLTNNLSWSRANKSGNKARFCWEDEKGIHKLHFSREKSKDLAILYSIETPIG